MKGLVGIVIISSTLILVLAGWLLSYTFAFAITLDSGLQSSALDDFYAIGLGGGPGVFIACDDNGLTTSTDSNGMPYFYGASWSVGNGFYFCPDTTSMELAGSNNSAYKFWIFYTRNFGDDNRIRSINPSSTFSSIGTIDGTFSVAGATISRVYWVSAFSNLTAASEFFLSSSRCTSDCRIYLTKWTTEDLSYIDTQAELYDYIEDDAGKHLVTGNINATTTWSGGQVYVLSGNVGINPGVTLTIDPGAIVKFDTATSSGLIVNGTLDAIGTEASSTFFTSLNDDLLGQDTNGDGPSEGSPGDWAGIEINSGGIANFGYSVIRYGGSVNGSHAMLHNNGGLLSVATSSTVAYSGDDYGVLNTAGTTTIVNADIGFNDYGLYLDGGSISVTATSTIHDNSSYGAFNNTAATSSFFAENNYWATTTMATSGPYNAAYNPSGTGDYASNYIDFDPWVGQIGTSNLPHYYIDGCPADDCGSVSNRQILLSASTTYVTELNAATSTWNAKTKVSIEQATSTTTLTLDDVDFSDVVWKGGYTDGSPGIMVLNKYYLDDNTSSERQNTIEHELGHALGLNHSYTGNVMYFLQSSQTQLGPEDNFDYDTLWP